MLDPVWRRRLTWDPVWRQTPRVCASRPVQLSCISKPSLGKGMFEVWRREGETCWARIPAGLALPHPRRRGSRGHGGSTGIWARFAGRSGPQGLLASPLLEPVLLKKKRGLIGNCKRLFWQKSVSPRGSTASNWGDCTGQGAETGNLDWAKKSRLGFAVTFH